MAELMEKIDILALKIAKLTKKINELAQKIDAIGGNQ